MITALWGDTTEAGGPWRGQIVDAETGQPVPGAVVLAAWWKRSPGWIHERREFHEAIEVVTDQEGRFVIPSVNMFSVSPLTRIQGPDVKIFKSGYGQWRFQGEPETRPMDVERRKIVLAETWRRFEGEGVVITLPPLKTKEERWRFRGLALPDLDIPQNRKRHYLKAIEQEDSWLGVRPAS